MHSPSRLKIGVVTQGYFTAGGVQTVARWLVQGLRAAGHEVDVYDLASSSSDLRSRSLRRPGSWLRGPVIEESADEPAVWHVGAPLCELEPARYLPRRALSPQLRKYDIIQVVAGGPSLALATLGSARPVALQVATRVVWERQSAATSKPAIQLLRRANTILVDQLERIALRRADATLVENAVMEEYASRHARGEVLLAPPGVDTERFYPAVGGWSPARPIISVGRLGDARKGLDRVITAYQGLCANLATPPELILAGRGILPTPVARLVENTPPNGKVSVRSDVPQELLPDLYRQASLFVQGSHEEGLGLSVVEAMASGLPVVATDTAGTRETVDHGKTGFLVDQTDDCTEQMTRRMHQVLSGDGVGMAMYARTRADDLFSSRATLARFTESYTRIIQSRNA